MNLLICIASAPPIGQSLPMGRLIARSTQAAVTLLHVHQNGGSNGLAAGEEILSAASAELGDIPHQTRLEQGDPADTILRVADETTPDMIVIGAHRTAGDDRPIVGKVARQVMNNASVSTLVAKTVPPTFERILVCSGGRPVAEPVVHMGAKLAQSSDARLTLLHVASPVPSMYTGLDAMEEQIEDLMQSDTPEAQHLRESAAKFERRGVEAVLELRHGVADDEIIRSCGFRNYDLVLIGAADSAPRLNRLLFGQVTQNVVERAPVSVLVVRASE